MAGGELLAVTRERPSRPRRPDWPERLAALVEERRHAPFAWGLNDCVSMAADAVQAMTGADPLAAFRGLYGTEEEADAIVGPDGLEAFVARLMAGFGAPECAPGLAQRGDWAFVEIGNHRSCGVVLGPMAAVPGADRLQFVPVRRSVIRAWAV